MLFKIENNLLIIDKDEIRGIKEFKRILERDKGSDGDVDGRKKYKAFKEFYYIYFVADWSSPGNKGGLNEKELHLQAVKYSQLEEGFKPDADIKAAIDIYREILELINPSHTFALKLLKGIKISEKVADSIIEVLEKVLELNKQKLQEEQTNLAEIVLNNTMLEDQLKKLTNLTNSFPKTLDTLNETLNKLSKEEANGKLGRGGKLIGNRADPK